MGKPVNKTLIGAFVLGALALTFAGIVVLGSGALFRTVREVVMFFDGSVAGLQVGAPVTFRGVAIGEVSKIEIVYEAGRQEFQIPVAAMLYPDRIQRLATTPSKTTLDELIERGLRAQLQLQSLITGQLSIQLDFFPNTPIRLVGPAKAGFGSRVKEIPTIPTPIQKIEKTIQQIPLDEVVVDLRDTLTSIKNILTSPSIPEIIANLRQLSDNAAGLTRSVDNRLANLGSQLDLTLKEVRTLVADASAQIRPLGSAIDETRSLAENVNRRIGPLEEDLVKTTADLRAALQQSEKALANINAMTSADSDFRYNVELFLTDLSATARSLRTLSDYLDRHPDSLLRGKAPAQPLGGQP
jgi:paraquat-inducible protein B